MIIGFAADIPAMKRRYFCARALLCGCSTQGAQKPAITARPGAPGSPRQGPGTHRLGLRARRDPLMYVPQKRQDPMPLVLYLHGAGGSEEQGPKRLGPLAEKLGFLLLSPASADNTWDAIRGDYGVDVKTIDQALRKVFDANAVDPKRIIAAGFSDGASYALGLAQRDRGLFTAAVAFSPGFIPGGSQAGGSARIFISHGTDDEILPIDQCSRQLVPRLKRDGYLVTYREFTGPHTVPAEVAEEGLRWATAQS